MTAPDSGTRNETTKRLVKVSTMENNASTPKTYQRFNVLHRLLHLVVIASFTLLAVTGFSLSFSGQWWARALVFLMGGADNAGALHRLCAGVFYLGVMVHLLWLGYFKLVLRGRLTGPQSAFPSKKDFEDLHRNFRYIFGKGEPPLFNRFSYLEKVDYWAVLGGMQSMGITGLLMWHPEFFSGFLPGYFINIAADFHFHEAVLAVAYIGFVHMTATHLNPDVFPMETSIFTGKTTREKIMREHPGEWQSMQTAAEAGPVVKDD